MGLDAIIAWSPRSDVDHGPPFAELGAKAAIFDQPLAQAIEPLRNPLALIAGEWLSALVHFDAGQLAGLLDDLGERGAVLGLLPDSLIGQDHAGDIGQALGAEQERAVAAPG